MSVERREVLRGRLRALGFDVVRFAAAEACGGDRVALEAWLREGMHGEMAWMERTVEKRGDPSRVLPGVKTVVALGVNYGARESGGGGPVWARYALHEDYHDTMKAGLAAAGRVLEEMFGVSGEDYRYYVDTGPVLERNWAARAGVGFVGKNAMVISREHGNWLFLAAILTRVEIEPDEPLRNRAVAAGEEGAVGLLCGKCTRCMDACPTQALVRPGVVDSRRCVSYQTIENRGVIPRELRAGIGRRIYGCDVCAEVCPWNRFAQDGRGVLLVARRELAELTLREILQLTPERFAAVFRRTAIKRVKLAGLLRNACVVAGNARDESALPELVRLAGEGRPLVRAHAVWAVFRVAGAEAAWKLLGEALERETDEMVLAEYRAEERAG
jgi:Uncharacterized Fe-S protein